MSADRSSVLAMVTVDETRGRSPKLRPQSVNDASAAGPERHRPAPQRDPFSARLDTGRSGSTRRNQAGGRPALHERLLALGRSMPHSVDLVPNSAQTKLSRSVWLNSGTTSHPEDNSLLGSSHNGALHAKHPAYF